MKRLASAPMLLIPAMCCAGLRAEVVVFPKSVTLTRADATQRLVVERTSVSQLVADVTPQAQFKTTDPAVATVDAHGVITAVHDGVAWITARRGDEHAHIEVKVSGVNKPFTWNFRKHITPILAKYGCSSGACHGAAAGKNGFKLSLRNWDPEFDYNALTREAAGRRVVKSDPDASLLLCKPTMRIKHSGGERFKPDSLEYRIIREWIAAGVPAPSESDPLVDHLVVMPDRVQVLAGATQQIIVQAVYSDGSVEDMTRWAKFSTTDEGV